MDEGTHPFGQEEYYFSESQKQLMKVADMPLPYARNVMNKLLREYDDHFRGSPLHEGLIARLQPATSEIRKLLLMYGEAAYYCKGQSTTEIRSKFYYVGKSIGRQVRTHKNGDFIEGRVV